MTIKQGLQIYHNMRELGIYRGTKWMLYKKINKSKYDKQLLKWLYNENRDILEKYKKIDNSIISKAKNNKTIWVLWWQGLDSMPKLIRACYESILEYKEDYSVVLLTKDNFTNYIDFSSNISKKINNKAITITHLSDLIRVKLLHEYGGIWIDASILLTADVSRIVGKTGFCTGKSKVDNRYISQARWTAFFWSNVSGLGCGFFALIEEMFDRYWNKHNFLVEYLLIDYIICLCYENISWVKKQLDEIPYNNCRIHELCKVINDRYNREEFDKITFKTHLHKLSYKINLEETTINGEQTFYGYIINRFLNK